MIEKIHDKTGVIVVLYQDLYVCSPENRTSGVEYIVIDNTPERDLKLEGEQLHYIPLKSNTGIAKAQNIGIEHARRIGCRYVLFLDQDSVPPAGFVENMIGEYKRIERIEPRLFLLGPSVINGRTGIEYKPRFNKDKPTAYGFVPRREIISSGCCTSLSKIEDVGLLDESLFIDLVDHEWCFRAKSKGYVSGITPAVRLSHYIGSNDSRQGVVQTIISSPIRFFYQTRNYVWLMKRSYVPVQWKVNTTIVKIIQLFVYPFKTKEWRAIYSNIFKGLVAGFKNANR